MLSPALLVRRGNPDHPLLLNCTTWLLKRNGELRSAPAKYIITKEILTELYGTDIMVIDIPQANRSACFMTLSSDLAT